MEKLKKILEAALLIVLVIAIGMLAVNQTLGFYYKVHFLKAPCDLCAELNPGVGECITNLNKGVSYPDGSGGWTDPFNKTIYNLSIIEETIN